MSVSLGSVPVRVCLNVRARVYVRLRGSVRVYCVYCGHGYTGAVRVRGHVHVRVHVRVRVYALCVSMCAGVHACPCMCQCACPYYCPTAYAGVCE